MCTPAAYFFSTFMNRVGTNRSVSRTTSELDDEVWKIRLMTGHEVEKGIRGCVFLLIDPKITKKYLRIRAASNANFQQMTKFCSEAKARIIPHSAPHTAGNS
jgi:hypothetical protein